MLGWFRWLFGQGQRSEKPPISLIEPQESKPSYAALTTTFTTRLAGVSHKNADGSGRQAEIKRCQKGDELLLEREPDNPVDPHAVLVRRAKTGVQIGYLRSEVAARLLDQIGGRERYSAFIERIDGGTKDKPTRGVQVNITVEL